MIIGIDPGKHGAIAKICPGLVMGIRRIEIHSLPEDINKSRKFIREAFLPITFGPSIFVEEVHASPQMGVVSAFSFGRRYEQILSVIETLGGEVNTVRPQHWQNAIGVLSGGDKGKLYDRAKKLFPTITFKRNEADALLIAYYGWKTMQSRQ